MNNTTTEQMLIAVLLSPGDHYKEILPQINVSLFTEQLCINVFKTIQALFIEGKSISLMSLLKKGKTIGSISPIDVSTITQWTMKITYNEPVVEFIEELKDEFIKRQVSFILAQESAGMLDSKSGSEIAYGINKKLTELLDTNTSSNNLVTLLDITNEERQLYYNRAALAASGQTSGIDTGIEAVNKYTGGWQNELIIIAARPSMGKTALALFHGVKSGKPGIYFNLEMNKSQLAQRLILQHSENIKGSSLRDGTLTQEQIMEFEQAIGKVEKLPFMVYDKPRCGVHQSIRIMRQQHRKGNCNWAIIDYLQLMTLEGSKGNNQEHELGEISRTLKAAQKELNIPIIALAQLNRDCEKRPDKKPMLSDLRGSGSLEQDADTVAFIYRPEYYGLSNEDGTPYTNEIFYLFEKHRNGATGSVEFRSNYNLSKFYNIDIAQPSLPIPTASTSFSNFTDPSWFKEETFE